MRVQSIMEALISTLESLITTHKDFPLKLKQRLILQSNNVTNPFRFIVELFTEGVLCDGSSDPDTTLGLKEIIVKLALMIASSKGVDAIGGLIKALEGSGNSQLISELNTWVKKDYSSKTSSDVVGVKGDASVVRPEKPKHSKKPKPKHSSGIKLLQRVISEGDKDLIKHLKGHLVGKASKVLNAPQMCSQLVRQSVLDERDFQLKTTPKAERRQWAEKAIEAACSKGAFGPLVVALQCSGNEHILQETLELLESLSSRRQKDPGSGVDPIAGGVEYFASPEQSKVVRSTFFDQTALADELTKLATFKTLQKSETKGTFAVQFERKRMMTLSSDCSLTIWNWQAGKEKPMEIAVKVQHIDCFQYDEEILVMGTKEGVVYLFDARTFEEKWSVRTGDSVVSLKFVESTLVVITQCYADMKLWWMDIYRPGMYLINRGPSSFCKGPDYQVPGVCVHPDTTFFYTLHLVYMFETKSGKWIRDAKRFSCTLSAPTFISTLAVGDLVSTKKVVLAGCFDGTIAIWITSEFVRDQSPLKAFQGHNERIVSLSFLSGHVLSLDQSGNILMWSGYDIVIPKATPVPRFLVQNSNVTNLYTHERWFSSCASIDDVIQIGTLPDLWLRTG